MKDVCFFVGTVPFSCKEITDMLFFCGFPPRASSRKTSSSPHVTSTNCPCHAGSPSDLIGPHVVGWLFLSEIAIDRVETDVDEFALVYMNTRGHLWLACFPSHPHGMFGCMNRSKMLEKCNSNVGYFTPAMFSWKNF